MGEGDWKLRPVKAHEEACGAVQIDAKNRIVPGVAEPIMPVLLLRAFLGLALGG